MRFRCFWRKDLLRGFNADPCPVNQKIRPDQRQPDHVLDDEPKEPRHPRRERTELVMAQRIDERDQEADGRSLNHEVVRGPRQVVPMLFERPEPVGGRIGG
jgi:hypothetical protein